MEISAATGVVQRLLSIDFAVPAELAADFPPGTQVPVPLTYLRRAGLVDFTITDAHGAAVPVLAEGAETAHLHPPLTGLMTGLLAAASPGAADGVALVHRCPDHQERLADCLAAALEQTVAVAHGRDLTDPLRPDGADIRSVFTALARTANALRPPAQSAGEASAVPAPTPPAGAQPPLEACAGHIAATLHRVAGELATAACSNRCGRI